jgi:hypothetical protein
LAVGWSLSFGHGVPCATGGRGTGEMGMVVLRACCLLCEVSRLVLVCGVFSFGMEREGRGIDIDSVSIGRGWVAVS